MSDLLQFPKIIIVPLVSRVHIKIKRREEHVTFHILVVSVKLGSYVHHTLMGSFYAESL